MTDPRFWGWLWQMEDEIRSLVPYGLLPCLGQLVPAPIYNNQPWYDSTDTVACISKVDRSRVVKEVVPDHKDVCLSPAYRRYIEVFKKIEDEEELAQEEES